MPLSLFLGCSSFSYQVFANESSDSQSKQGTSHQSEYSKRIKFFRGTSILLAGLFADELLPQSHGLFKPGQVLLQPVAGPAPKRLCRRVPPAALPQLQAGIVTAFRRLNQRVQSVSQLGALSLGCPTLLVRGSCTS